MIHIDKQVSETKYRDGIMLMYHRITDCFVVIKNKQGEIIKSGPDKSIERVFIFQKYVQPI